MKNELITKEEAINAGFKEIGEFKRAICLNKDVDILLSLGYDYKEAFIYVKGTRIKEFEASQRFLNQTSVFFTGKDLDFTPKQKDYSWDAVLNRKQADSFVIRKDIEKIATMIAAPDSLKAKLIALLKLHYIIEELDRDFEADGYAYYIYIDPRELTFDLTDLAYQSGEIITICKEAAKILIDNHAQLLKDALGVK